MLLREFPTERSQTMGQDYRREEREEHSARRTYGAYSDRHNDKHSDRQGDRHSDRQSDKQSDSPSNSDFLEDDSRASLPPVPEEFVCPLSLQLMGDPVILASGLTLDRPSAHRWLAAGHRACPLSGLPLEHPNVCPNLGLRARIAHWLAANGAPEHPPGYQGGSPRGSGYANGAPHPENWSPRGSSLRGSAGLSPRQQEQDNTLWPPPAYPSQQPLGPSGSGSRGASPLSGAGEGYTNGAPVAEGGLQTQRTLRGPGASSRGAGSPLVYHNSCGVPEGEGGDAYLRARDMRRTSTELPTRESAGGYGGAMGGEKPYLSLSERARQLNLKANGTLLGSSAGAEAGAGAGVEAGTRLGGPPGYSFGVPGAGAGGAGAGVSRNTPGQLPLRSRQPAHLNPNPVAAGIPRSGSNSSVNSNPSSHPTSNLNGSPGHSGPHPNGASRERESDGSDLSPPPQSMANIWESISRGKGQGQGGEEASPGYASGAPGAPGPRLAPVQSGGLHKEGSIKMTRRERDVMLAGALEGPQQSLSNGGYAKAGSARGVPWERSASTDGRGKDQALLPPYSRADSMPRNIGRATPLAYQGGAANGAPLPARPPVYLNRALPPSAASSSGLRGGKLARSSSGIPAVPGWPQGEGAPQAHPGRRAQPSQGGQRGGARALPGLGENAEQSWENVLPGEGGVLLRGGGASGALGEAQQRQRQGQGAGGGVRRRGGGIAQRGGGLARTSSVPTSWADALAALDAPSLPPDDKANSGEHERGAVPGSRGSGYTAGAPPVEGRPSGGRMVPSRGGAENSVNSITSSNGIRDNGESERGGPGGAYGALQRQGSWASSAGYSESSSSVSSAAQALRAGEAGRGRAIEDCVAALQFGTDAERKSAAREIRSALKGSPENKRRLVAAHGIPPLVECLGAEDPGLVEQAAQALMNLALHGEACPEIVRAGGIPLMVRTLHVGTPAARGYAAALLFASSKDEDSKLEVLGAGGIPPLLSLLAEGTLRSKKDAALALYTLSTNGRCALEIVKLGAIGTLLKQVEDAEPGLEEKAVALVANLCRFAEGCEAAHRGGALTKMVDLLEEGATLRVKEDASAVLLQLCASGSVSHEQLLAEGVLPSLVQISESSTATSEARTLLETLRKKSAERGKGRQ